MAEFTNNHIDIAELPRFEDISYTDLDRRFATIRLTVVIAIYMALFVLVFLPLQLIAEISSFRSTILGTLIFVGVAIVLGLSAWFVFAYTRSIRYCIRQHDIILKSGLLWRKEVIQPLKRVQHVELTRGPIDKRFGLANIRLFSAGTALSTFRIPGIDYDTATRIKAFVLAYQEFVSNDSIVCPPAVPCQPDTVKEAQIPPAADQE